MSKVLQITLVTVLTSLVSFISYAQPVLNSSNTEFHAYDYSETFSLTDSKNNIHIFFTGYNKIGHLEYDSTFNLLKENRYKVNLGGTHEVQGYYIENGEIKVYFSNQGLKNFRLFTLKTDGNFDLKSFGFEKEQEVVVKKINSHNNFYILTNVKKSSILKVYSFKDAGYSTFKHDFSKDRFFSEENKITTLWHILKKQSIQVIEDEVATSIESSSEPIKIYPTSDKIIVTLNHRKSATRIISMNLDSQKSNVDNLMIPKFRLEKRGFYKSNSFIYKNVIYQLLCNRNQLFLQFFDLNEKELIKEYHLNKEDNFNFKNTPIYEGSATISLDNQQLDDTKTFLRRITKSRVGISALEKNGNIITTIGGTREITTSPSMPMMMGGFPIASLGNITLSINPLFGSFDAYSQTRSVYTRCLFDESNFKHIKGFAGINVFDLIAVYKSREIKDLTPKHETILKYENFFIYGYLIDQEYRLVKF